MLKELFDSDSHFFIEKKTKEIRIDVSIFDIFDTSGCLDDYEIISNASK